MTWLEELKELRARLAAAEETHNFDLISQVVCDYETALHDNADRLITLAEKWIGSGSGCVRGAGAEKPCGMRSCGTSASQNGPLGFGSVVDAGGDLGKSVVVEVKGSNGKVYSAAKGGPYGVDLDMVRPWVGP